MGPSRLLDISIWAGPVCSMNCRINGTDVEDMGRPFYSTAHGANGTGRDKSKESRSNFGCACFALVEMIESTIGNR